MKNQFKKQFPSFLLETRNCFSLLSSYIIFQYISLQEHQYNLMIPVSKVQKAVRACTIRLLNLGHAKHEKAAIYAVNQRILNVCRIAGAALQRSNS